MRFLIACVLGWAIVAASVAGAASYGDRSLPEIIDASELVLIGTVAALHSAWADEDQDSIFTYVTLTDVEPIKGQVPGPNYILRLSGGVVGDTAEVYPGLPRFRTGERYILFVRGNFRHLFPVVGLGAGMFRVVTDRAGGEPVVQTSDGRPVSGITGGAVKAASAPGGAAAALTVAEFVREIRRHLQEQ